MNIDTSNVSHDEDAATNRTAPGAAQGTGFRIHDSLLVVAQQQMIPAVGHDLVLYDLSSQHGEKNFAPSAPTSATREYRGVEIALFRAPPLSDPVLSHKGQFCLHATDIRYGACVTHGRMPTSGADLSSAYVLLYKQERAEVPPQSTGPCWQSLS